MNSKPRSIFLFLAVICLIIALKFEIFSNFVRREATIGDRAEFSQWTGQSLDENNVQERLCEAPTSYIFLKKHKVASTTLKQLFGRVDKYFGIQSEPALIGPQGGCYPARINPDCWPSAGRPTFDGGGSIKYHFRWNPELADQLFPKSSIKITSIREPLSCFRSVYEYFYYKIKKGFNRLIINFDPKPNNFFD